jgi:hypothetical protein
VRKVATVRKAVEAGTPTPVVVAVNAATVGFVDELLRLPSPSAARTAVDLLYGRRHPVPPAVLAHVNGGLHVPLAELLSSASPLALPLAERLRVPAAWRGAGQAVKAARAAARARYRELQNAFVSSVPPAPRDPVSALVRYTYRYEGHQWLWEEVAARLLHRVAVLNRAVLDLLAAAARGEQPTDGLPGDALPEQDFDLPTDTLDLLAAALPPVAVPAWDRLVQPLEGRRAVALDEDAVGHYRSLLAEILGLQEQPEHFA